MAYAIKKKLKHNDVSISSIPLFLNRLQLQLLRRHFSSRLALQVIVRAPNEFPASRRTSLHRTPEPHATRSSKMLFLLAAANGKFAISSPSSHFFFFFIFSAFKKMPYMCGAVRWHNTPATKRALARALNSHETFFCSKFICTEARSIELNGYRRESCRPRK